MLDDILGKRECSRQSRQPEGGWGGGAGGIKQTDKQPDKATACAQKENKRMEENSLLYSTPTEL